MKVVENFKTIFQGIIRAGSRYPLTVLFLLAVTLLNGNMINQEKDLYTNYLFTLFVGAILSGVAQQLHERFFYKQSQRFMLAAAACLLTIGYYFILPTADLYELEAGIKTSVFVFALVLLYILIPTIKKRLTFNESFIAAFKAFFITSLFTIVIAIGVSSILFAIDRLLFSIDDKLTLHVLNIVFSLFAPLYYLSFTPIYEDTKDKSVSKKEKIGIQEKLNEATSVPRMLEVLISYVFIPLTAVYTAILLAYIVINISSSFWTDNLLEPLLVSYAVVVIVVYILSSTIENKFAVLFRKFFPKLLIPIVLFQTIASVLKIGEMGMTQGRYYVILFGVFATISGVIFSFLPVNKNGYAIAVLIAFSILSILPPIDAFTVSRISQTNLLEDILVENKMLEKDKIIPNAAISKEDKIRITGTSDYLAEMNYARKIEWLPDDLTNNNDFEATFGFNREYENQTIEDMGRYINLDYEDDLNISLEDYQQLMRLHFYTSYSDTSNSKDISFEVDGVMHTVVQQQKNGSHTVVIRDADGKEQMTILMEPIFNALLSEENLKKGIVTVDEATIIEENDQFKVKIIVESLNEYDGQYAGDVYLLVQIK
ncbi:protein of unknown function [Carnobacterium iners]|uniref:Uncharacterized protein n=1 Tax=Carnobacterium iners TaxID=1073423 RepID=A0A1X7MPQ0_9LACT|nr:DUF4153 domain-containing protein [Carnobacterium iners]SEL23310.1 protein of unknown function [Carnobacterium iners]SMH26318.1 protein of unknown function [Carnobacterium iners]